MGTGGWSWARESSSATGRPSCSVTWRGTRACCSSGERSSTSGDQAVTRRPKWGAVASRRKGSGELPTSAICRPWTGTTAWCRCRTSGCWLTIQIVTASGEESTQRGGTTSTMEVLVETSGALEINYSFGKNFMNGFASLILTFN